MVKFPPSSFGAVVGSGMDKHQDPGSGVSIPDPPHWILRLLFYSIVCTGEVKPTPEGGNQKIKLKVRINPSGVFNVSSAAMIEKVEIEEEVPVQMEVRYLVPHGYTYLCILVG
jgi:hypothetical protein